MASWDDLAKQYSINAPTTKSSTRGSTWDQWAQALNSGAGGSSPRRFWQLLAKPVDVGLDLLQRGEYMTANIVDALASGENPIVEAWKGLKGEDKTNWQDIVDKYLWKDESIDSKLEGQLRGALGLLLGIVADPTTWINPFSVVGKGAKAARAASPVVDDAFKLAAKVSDVVADIPAARKLRSMFKTTPRGEIGKAWSALNKEFDRTISKAGIEALEHNTTRIQQFLKLLDEYNMKPGDVMELIEKGSPEDIAKLPQPIVDFIDDTTKRLEERFAAENAAARALGIPEIQPLKAKGRREILEGAQTAATAAEKAPVDDTLIKIIIDKGGIQKPKLEGVFGDIKPLGSIQRRYKGFFSKNGKSVGELVDELNKLGYNFKNGQDLYNALVSTASDLSTKKNIVVPGAETVAQKTTKLLDAFGNEIDVMNTLPTVDLGYIMHVPTGEGKLREFLDDIKSWFKPVREEGAAKATGPYKVKVGGLPEIEAMAPFGHTRKLEGSVRDINTALGYQKFVDNPAVASAVRELYGITYEGNLRRLKAIKDTFGKAIDSVPADELGKYAQLPKGALKGAFDDVVFDKELVPYLQSYIKIVESPKEMSKFLKYYDQAQEVFKKLAYSVWPASHVRNMFDNTIKAYMWGMSPEKIPIRYKQMLDIQLGKTGKVAGYTNDELLEVMRRTGVLDTFTDVDLGKGVSTALQEVAENAQKQLSGASASIGHRIANAAGNVWEGKLAGFVEGNARGAFFIDRLLKGDTPEKAAEMVKKVFFDYADLTDFEKNVMKRIFPFYTFTRKNIPLQFEALLNDPGRFGRPFKVANAIASDQELPYSLYDWQAEALGLPVGNETYYTDSWELRERAKVFPLEYWLSQLGIFDVVPSRAVDKALDMLSPFIKQPIEQIFNKQLWNDRPIATADTTGGRVLQRLDTAAKSFVRPYSEGMKIGKGLLDGSIEDTLMRLLTGYRTYDVSMDYGKPKQSQRNTQSAWDMLLTP